MGKWTIPINFGGKSYIVRKFLLMVGLGIGVLGGCSMTEGLSTGEVTHQSIRQPAQLQLTSQCRNILLQRLGTELERQGMGKDEVIKNRQTLSNLLLARQRIVQFQVPDFYKGRVYKVRFFKKGKN